jgi:hypothetical protein
MTNSKDADEEDYLISPLRSAAVQMHEMYSEFHRAGFTKRQSLFLVSRVVAFGMTQGIEDAKDKKDNIGD